MSKNLETEKMGKKSDLPIQKRKEAILALIRKEESASAIARRYGVSENTLNRWLEAFIKGGIEALSRKSGGAGRDAEVSRLEKEIELRDRVIGEITIANTILKKRL